MNLELIPTGKSFLFALGRSLFLYVADTYFIKEINSFTSLDMGKPDYLQKDRGALLARALSPQMVQFGPLSEKNYCPPSFCGQGQGTYQSGENL